MRRKLTIIAALVLCFQTAGAQKFATRQIEYLAGLLECRLPAQSDTFSCPEICKLPLIVDYDPSGTICHLGIALFPDSLKNQDILKPLYTFQERLFLEMFLQKDKTKALNLLKEYKIELMFHLQISDVVDFKTLELNLQAATRASKYVLTKDSLTWISMWKTDNVGFSLRFPANYDLISGMDKKEAELWLARQLQNYHVSIPPTSHLPLGASNLRHVTDNMYVLNGKTLFIKGMNSNIYFNLLFDRRFPEESIANLFNHPDANADGLTLQMQQLIYGDSIIRYKIELSNILSYMSSNNYDVYTGIENCYASRVEFSVIYSSKLFNCTHLLFVTTTINNLFDKKEPLEVSLHAFIPNQNIKNLYKEYKDR